ncbi:hypothetical protein CTheo_6521 [Ceratobasidium theobromae]|uniref:Uroporphyrin-III C-methyltransferase n=1 Tax=Ceratobasidium theobromae TaxID=1582974 RepID=A0A5N5QEZ4_9AGAM|nr:hypothetical protein CTheo_6521 [Ceratobasidium theobromae]
MVRYPEPTRGGSLMVALRPAQRAVLVVGSGLLAASRVFAALEADATVLVAAGGSIRSACEEVQWRVYHGDAEWLDAGDVEGDSFGALLDMHDIQLVCVTDTLSTASPRRSAASATAIVKACRERRILVNVADMPSLCDFAFPATHRFALSQAPRDPNLRTVDEKGSALQIAVTANGHGCRMAARLKREVVARLPRNIGDAVENIGRLRLLARAGDPGDMDEDDPTPINKPVAQRSSAESPEERSARRMRWVAQLSEYTPLEQLAALDEAAMRDMLDSRSDAHPILSHHSLSSPTEGRIILVGSGPGHPALLTRAALHALHLATLVLADKLVPAEILALVPKHAHVKVAKKFPGNAEHAQDEFIKLAIDAARAGKCVVRLKQGDPYLYGRGGEELLAFMSATPPLPHPPLVVPGISSALAAPLLAAIPVTQRNVADTLVVCTAVAKGGKGGVLVGYHRARTVSILMGVARLPELVQCLLTGTSAQSSSLSSPLTLSGPTYPPCTPVAIVERASMPDQRVVATTLDRIQPALERQGGARPPAMVVVGWAVLALARPSSDTHTTDDSNDPARIDQWLSGRDYILKEGMDDGWDMFK